MLGREASAGHGGLVAAMAREGRKPFRYRGAIFGLLGLRHPELPAILPTRRPVAMPLVYREDGLYREAGLASATGWSHPTAAEQPGALPRSTGAPLHFARPADVVEPTRPAPSAQASAPGAARETSTATVEVRALPQGPPVSERFSGGAVRGATVATRSEAQEAVVAPGRTQASAGTANPAARIASAGRVPALPAVQVEIPTVATRPAPATAPVSASAPKPRPETSTVAAAPPRPASPVSGQATVATPALAPTQLVRGPATERTTTAPSAEPAQELSRAFSRQLLHARESIARTPRPVAGPQGPAKVPRARALSDPAPLRPRGLPGLSREADLPPRQVQEKLAELARQIATLRQGATAAPLPSPSGARQELSARPAMAGFRRASPPPSATVWARHHLGHFRFRLAR